MVAMSSRGYTSWFECHSRCKRICNTDTCMDMCISLCLRGGLNP